MKRAIVILTSLLALQAYGQPRDWENPAVLGIHKLPYHATLQLPSREKECKEIVSLDGQWLFHWSPTPESRSFIGVRRQNHVLQTSIVRITT